MSELINTDYPFQTVSVIGLGYIGLPTAAILASRKIKVIGVDICIKTVNTVNRGEIHIVEPELDIVVRATTAEGYLKATTKPEYADVFIIAVPTPFKKNNIPDLSYIQAACQSIATVLRKGNLIILESTSPVGTTEQVSEWLADLRTDLTFPTRNGEESDVRVSYCPERVLPGHVLRELVQNDRIIGGITPKCSVKAMELYRIFVEGECLVTNSRTAEMCKLVENSYRDVNIAFANELSVICDRHHINVWELINLANRHPRVNILKPGPGVGGHCIAVDPWFIVSQSPEDARLISTARMVNDSKPCWVLAKVEAAILQCIAMSYGKQRSDVIISCFGLAFKPDIDDLRESPALSITKSIAASHIGRVSVVEPHINELPSCLVGLVEMHTIEYALSNSDIILILVSHKSFKNIFNNIPESVLVIDTCGLLSGQIG